MSGPSSQSRPSQRRSRMTASCAPATSRFWSVSSRRRMNCPPCLRANIQLKRALRALPMCRYPGGEGAKRTRTVMEDPGCSEWKSVVSCRRLAKLLLAVAHTYGFDDADSHEEGQQGATAVADEGKGQAGNGQNTDVHADADEGLEKEDAGDAHTEEAPGRIWGDLRHLENTQQDEGHQPDDDQ